MKSDLVRVLDEVLPAAFGGGPADYQLIVEEGPNAAPQLLLLVSPLLGEIDAHKLRELFLQEVSKGDEAYKLMCRLVAEADYLKVERSHPRATVGGKILPVMQTTSVGERKT